MATITYRDAGVDIEEGARAVDAIKKSVRSTYTADVIGDIGGFGGLYSADSLKGMEQPVLVSGTDGVGTKLALAKRLNRHSTVGIDLVAMCANDIVTSGARPLFFLDYLAIGKLRAEFVQVVVEGISQGCLQAGCAFIGGETAEHPGVMEPDDYDLGGFCVGAVDRGKMIGPDKVRAGDVLIGLESSGLHSNGYSLVRKAFTDKLTDDELREGCVDDMFGAKLADALLEPTRIYVRDVLAAMAACGGSAVRAAAHITGGGITENLNRALPSGLDASVDLSAWRLPPIIRHVADAAGLSAEETLCTFNAGVGMVLVVDPAGVSAVLEVLKSAKYGVFEMGEVLEAPSPDSSPRVLYTGELG